MSNIQKYSHLQVSTVDDLARISKAMAASGMFTDVRDAAQAMVKIQAGAELGLPPFASMSGVHVIKGKPVIGAGLMASMIDAHPDYDYEPVVQNEKVCEIKFFKNGKLRGTSKFTEEDARKAGTQNMGKYPANMLFARCMSNGVKWYCPGVFAGPVYVPEEMEEVTEDVQHIEVKQEPKPKQASTLKTSPDIKSSDVESATDLNKDPEFLHKTDFDEGQPAPWEEESKWPPVHPEQPAKTETKKELLQLANHTTITAAEKNSIVGEINGFTEVEARRSIDWLKDQIRQREKAAAQSALPPGYKAPAQQTQATEEMITKQQAAILKRTLNAKEIPAKKREATLASMDTMTKKQADEAINKALAYIKQVRESQKTT